jgi:uncharacterized protein (DUF4415 family)
MPKIVKQPTILIPTQAENKRIVVAAKSDPDAQPLTARQLKEMVPLKSLRGRPKSGNAKQLISVRYSTEVIAYFRSTGEGWQARMDEVLRDYVARMARSS